MYDKGCLSHAIMLYVVSYVGKNRMYELDVRTSLTLWKTPQAFARCIDTYYSSPINLMNKAEIHRKSMLRALSKTWTARLYVHLYACVNLQHTNLGVFAPYHSLDIQEIIPLFPFVLCVSVCLFSNPHAYTVFSTISPLRDVIWRQPDQVNATFIYLFFCL